VKLPRRVGSLRRIFHRGRPRRERSPDASTRAGEIARLARDAGWALFGRLLSKLAAVVVLAMLARALSRADFGTYLLIVSVAGVFSFVADLGLSQAIVLLVARAHTERDIDLGFRTVASAWHLLFLGGTVAFLIAVSPAGRWLIELLSGRGAAAASLGLAAILGVLGVAKAAQLLGGEMFRGFGDIRAASLYGELFPNLAIAISIVVAALSVPRLSLTAALMVTAAVPIVVAGVSWLMFQRAYGRRASLSQDRRGRPDRYRAASKGAVLHASWPLFGYRLTMYLATQVDLWVAGAVLGVSAAASYGAALKLLILIDLPLVVSNLALAPRIARYLRKGRDAELQSDIRRVAAIVGVIGWGGLALAVLGREPLLDVVFGSGYGSTAAPVVAILAAGRAVYYWSGSSSMSLIMGGQQRLLLAISTLSAAVTTILTLLLGVSTGIRGVAIGAASGTVLYNWLTWFAANRRLRLRTDPRIGALRELGLDIRQMLSASIQRRKPS
jgi:O-antigen/teichoic acid export membrane protein